MTRRAGVGIYFELAALAHSNGRVAVLERSLRASVRLLPAFGDGHFELGNTFHSQNRFAEVVGSFEVALRQGQLGDRGILVYNNLANALTEVGHEQRAERAYSQGLRLWCLAARPPPSCSMASPTTRARAAATRRPSPDRAKGWYGDFEKSELHKLTHTAQKI